MASAPASRMLQLTEPNLLINVIFSSHLGRTVPSTVSLSRTDCCYGTIQHRGDETRGAVQDAEEQSEAAGWVARRCARQRRHEDEWRFSQRYHNGPIEGTFCIIASKESGGCRNSRLCFLRRWARSRAQFALSPHTIQVAIKLAVYVF